GFCAGVERAIEIVEQALAENGPPVYVRHEIVHNRHVVDGLRAKGAVFVEELDEVPDDALVVFSAHGVPKRVPTEAKRRNLIYADATCPLVSKVHRGVEQHYKSGRTVLLIGHSGHPEVVGTMGQLPEGAVILVENVDQAEALEVPDPDRLAYATQTTLSLRETESVIEVLRRRFPAIVGPRREDICYATTNRQRAVEAIAPLADLTLIIGSPNSSNSVRLVEVARAAGCPEAALVHNAAGMDWGMLDGVSTVAMSAGASAPEELVEELIDACQRRFAVAVREIEVVKEDVSFKTPPIPLRQAS
ncbi:MAG TPA: 4-hydroxy-3-methylbut-2-enyl diphosphate reductase, partial [Geminicoccaceae bacterium]|nr:4-hydroxy-3-methylbut-2-enyl diphosphate reductase [Geminicoccaceae bacterium]